MASQTSLLSSPLFADLGSEELSDDRIQQLLLEAETRLKSKNEKALQNERHARSDSSTGQSRVANIG